MKAKLYDLERLRNPEVVSYITRERNRLHVFELLYPVMRLFHHRGRIAPRWLLLKLYVFVKNLYRHVSVYYYFKDTDDVGLFECFILDNAELDQINDISDLRVERLNRESHRLSLYGHDYQTEQRDRDHINMRLTTIHKKTIIAERAVAMNTAIFYFSQRVFKLNPDLYTKLDWAYRMLRASVHLRVPRFFEDEQAIIERPNVELIAEIASAEL